MHQRLAGQARHHAARPPAPSGLRMGLPVRSRRPPVVLASAEPGKGPQEFGLAPAKPKTPYGEMLQYYLKMQPELFKSAVEDQLRRLKEEKEAKEQSREQSAGAEASAAPQDQAQLTLFRRMEEVRASEVRATLEDLMYVSILEKFLLLGVEMLPRMDGYVDVTPVNLKALTEGMHSKEALELVREHLLSVMGPTAMSQFSNAALKMSKFQMAQVYAASIMFGYFLRRVDQRFQLEKAMGSLEVSREDAVARLEKLFAQADTQDAPWETPLTSSDTDTPTTSSSSSSSASSSASSGQQDKKEEKAGSSTADWLGGPMKNAPENNLPAKKPKSALRRYVESFDQATMVETARIVSVEGAALVERQTSALLGDIKQLTMEMQEAVGNDATSMTEVMQRMARAVESDAIQTLTMTVGTQRRAVLEAVAFGTFLRDVESEVDTNYNLLTIRAPLLLKNGDDIGGLLDDDDEE